MKALVTGVAGFIGSQLAESLIQDGADVIGIDSFTDYYAREIKFANLEKLSASSQFQLVDGSIEAVDLSIYLRDCTHVFHLAAQAIVSTSYNDPLETISSKIPTALEYWPWRICRLFKKLRSRFAS